MSKAAVKKKTNELSNRPRTAKIKEKNDRDMRDEDDDDLFVSQSPPSQQRTLKRTVASRALKAQAGGSRLDEKDAYGSMDLPKYEKIQTKRAAPSKRQSKPFEELEKVINAHNKDREREIEDILTRCMATEKTFASSLHNTFASVMGDGYTAQSRTQRSSHVLTDVAQQTLAKAQATFQEYDGRALELSCSDSNATFAETRSNWAADLKRTKAVLEVGRMVGEDMINMKLSGQVPVVQDPDYHDASNAFFGEEEEKGVERETWAYAAKSQGKIVKRMTAAIVKE